MGSIQSTFYITGSNRALPLKGVKQQIPKPLLVFSFNALNVSFFSFVFKALEVNQNFSVIRLLGKINKNHGLPLNWIHPRR